jgi:hypothetical protein
MEFIYHPASQQLDRPGKTSLCVCLFESITGCTLMSDGVNFKCKLIYLL